MVEKWLQSKPNPYVKRVVRHPIKTNRVFPQKSAYYGMPAQLFKDSDKDRVANVFDCRPHNKKKTDVISPANWGSGYTDMYQRQENERLAKLYAKQQQEAYEKQLKELQRISGETTTIVQPGTTTEHYTSYAYDPGSGTVVSGPTATKEALQNQVNIVTGKTPTTTKTYQQPIVVLPNSGPLLISTPTSVKKPSLGTSILNIAKTVYKAAKVSPIKVAVKAITGKKK